jgi:hypothetical protein
MVVLAWQDTLQCKYNVLMLYAAKPLTSVAEIANESLAFLLSLNLFRIYIKGIYMLHKVCI